MIRKWLLFLCKIGLILVNATSKAVQGDQLLKKNHAFLLCHLPYFPIHHLTLTMRWLQTYQDKYFLEFSNEDDSTRTLS